MKEKIELLYQMKLIRAAEMEISARYSNGKMRCPTHLSIGQEATAVGVCAALRKTDLAVSTHRAHAHYLAKGGSLRKMIAEIYGKETGCSRGRGGSMHLIDLDVGFEGSTAIVGNTIPVGVGLGLAISLAGDDRVSCIFVGDGATEEGVFYESVNFAVVRNLPILFLCENNQYSVYSGLSVRQPKGRVIHEMAQSLGLQSHYADGNDILAVKDVVQVAVQNIRNKRGPQFVELSTYRWLEHCGPNYDNHIGYREEAEFQAWKARDPVMLFEQALRTSGLLTDEMEHEIDARVRSEVEEAFQFAESSPFPDLSTVDHYIYKQVN
ncbi:pyruvate/2-oxoglutarate dehydrogenase complex, dehydrogenase component alpha subunit [Herbaspirillum sp. CF444]|uniref:thiamine pyrophosphate-dependent dehydrogenase E1 component subunit alpha n=1 Tax=Herbaspirillum sp. CF444 TaxID=1144319 RepID=UPI0002722E1F|nr:thiamine pyrophosphate-dependent dehydrogenase E1 component subunit alpha [Herbaspirillum sp. CF444]EJL81426.1 pyruvate/2-oxoglutarate dehydrogenase complex, dehydrogenase component alpha subunit [Herbaspirillum sp. CF444]